MAVDGQPGVTIGQHFAGTEDPRMERTRRHKLLDIIVVAICAAICGTDDWVAIQGCGQASWSSSASSLNRPMAFHRTIPLAMSSAD